MPHRNCGKVNRTGAFDVCRTHVFVISRVGIKASKSLFDKGFFIQE